MAFLAVSHAHAVTPDSPEVRALIGQGLKYLESKTDHRLGGKCLIALAFLKSEASHDHPRITEALEACQAMSVEQILNDSVYSNGLAVILLSELNDPRYHDLMSRFGSAMEQRQKDHGGWGYENRGTGDTSQTQYAVLCNWELLRSGLTPNVESVEACTNWLLRTQDPYGAWGYQGKDPGSFELTSQGSTSSSMMAAGLGSLMICGDMLGLIKPYEVSQQQQSHDRIPAALERTNEQGAKRTMRILTSKGVDKTRLLNAISRGQAWYETQFKLESHGYPGYLLYSLERYKSFEEFLSGNASVEPDWYQQGFDYLKKSQNLTGGWSGSSGSVCTTAFSVLFLLRSTQRSLEASLGEGTLIGGRGLSANLAQMKVRYGRLVVKQELTQVDQLLGMLEDSDSKDLEALIANSAALSVSNVGAGDARRLQQIVRSGKPQARLLAVRALGKMRELDYVPTLLYAMTDPDKRVVREARDALRFVSRRFQGFGLPDNFDETQQYRVLDKWKAWYRHVRPDALSIP